MNIIIVGAGKVGATAAEVLSNKNDVMVIEEDTVVAEKIKSLYNVSIFNESGTNPKVLEEAIRRHQAEIIISTVSEDADNLYICMMSKRIKPDITTISRIRDPDYMVNDSYGIVDQIFSPELLSANILSSLALLENGVDYESFETIDMGLATFSVTKENTSVIGKVPIGLDMPEGAYIVAIKRSDAIILDCETVEIRMADSICVLGTPKGIEDFNQMMGVDRPASDFVILGATVIGVQTARLLESKKRYVKLIDNDPVLCRRLARQFSTVKIINGNIVDPHLLKMENVARADVLMTLDNNDETNLLASLMGKKLGATKIISEYSVLDYESIFEFAEIPSRIGYYNIVTNQIAKMIKTEGNSSLMMKHDGRMFFSMIIQPKSEVTDQYVGDVKLPEGCRLTGLIRDGEVIFPRLDTKFQEGDQALMFTNFAKLKKLEKMFGIELNYSV